MSNQVKANEGFRAVVTKGTNFNKKQPTHTSRRIYIRGNTQFMKGDNRPSFRLYAISIVGGDVYWCTCGGLRHGDDWNCQSFEQLATDAGKKWSEKDKPPATTAAGQPTSVKMTAAAAAAPGMALALIHQQVVIGCSGEQEPSNKRSRSTPQRQTNGAELISSCC